MSANKKKKTHDTVSNSNQSAFQSHQLSFPHAMVWLKQRSQKYLLLTYIQYTSEEASKHKAVTFSFKLQQDAAGELCCMTLALKFYS